MIRSAEWGLEWAGRWVQGTGGGFVWSGSRGGSELRYGAVVA
jgi:hypothetical protein